MDGSGNAGYREPRQPRQSGERTAHDREQAEGVKEQRALSSLHRGLDTLELLARLGEASQSELAEQLRTSRASTFRVIQVLKQRGYVEHNQQDHHYQLGRALSALAVSSTAQLLKRTAGPAMAHLRDDTQETVNVALIRGGRIIYDTIFETNRSVRFSAKEGDFLPPHASALGKAILAELTDAQRDMFLGDEPYARFTASTLTTREVLEVELAEIRKRGYAIDDEEVEVGACCLAAAIRGRNNEPIGAISVSAVAARVADLDRPRIGRKVREAAEEISRDLRREAVEDGGSSV
jgi:IclR family acetate operon transcriptional repressor